MSVARRHYGALCSEFYDLTKPVEGSYPDVPYYLRRLDAIRGRVLEAAVGTGRLLIPLLRAGVHADGIDSSPEMLDYCRRNCDAAGVEATLYCEALEQMDLRVRYEAILIAFGSFMLLSDPIDAHAALTRMRRHLAPGGRLFLDVDAPSVAGGRLGGHDARRLVDCRDGSTIILVDVAASDGLTERVERRVLSYEKWKDGHVVAEEVQDFRLRYYEQDEVRGLLRDAGFTGIEVCGDYAEHTLAAAARHWLCFSAHVAE